MATLNIFQQYSQAENTITNNVLLLFSRLYENSPAIYQQFINNLLGDENICSVVPVFRQQVGKGGAGIVDGHITTQSSVIVIETKIKGKENIEKLISYCDRFKEEDSKVLLHISSDLFTQTEIQAVEKRTAKIDKSIRFFSISFENIADGLTQLTKFVPYDQEIGRLERDFRSYYETSGLFSDEPFLLRTVACGESKYLNREYSFYFDPEYRSFRPHKYLGIYYEKSVHLIGEIKAIVDAELVNGKVNIIKIITGKLTDTLTKNLEAGFIKTVNDGWKIDKGHKFFLCEKLYETNFRKTSDYGIYSQKYFDLRNMLEMDTKDLPDVASIAKILSSKTWE